MVGLLRPRTVYLKSNECALFSVSLRYDFSVSSSPYCNRYLYAQMSVSSYFTHSYM